MRPKVAFFDFTGCEGCQLTVLQLEDQLLDLLGAVEIVNFREAMTERSDDYQIAFVEGSMATEADLERVKGIREKAQILVALGACACQGGINMIRNSRDVETVKKMVYGESAKYFDKVLPAMPVNAVVPVDYYVRGCPVDGNEFLEVTKSLLLGKKPNIPDYPMCVDCRLKENVCVFDKGLTCMGPVTRAGCGAICPSYGYKCEGCRGLIDDPNVNSHKQVLAEHGLTTEDILSQFSLFNAGLEVAKK